MTALGDLVSTNPAAARVLDAHDLDYCCGGQRTLEEACSAAGIDASAILDEIDGLGDSKPADWASMGPTELIDHLESTHHAYLNTELPRLSALAAKVESAHADRRPELADVRATYETLRADLEPHLMKEEQVLFPMVRELEVADDTPTFHCGSLRNPIGMMGFEHDRAGDLLGRLHELTGGYTVPDDACASYQAFYGGLADLERDTHLHIHKENNVLFPAVLELEVSKS